MSRDNPSAAKSLSLWERWHCGAMTERASRLSESLCAARSSTFVRARLSLCLHALVSTLALSGASRQLSQGESLGKQKAGRTGGQVCVSRILFLFCTGRRTRAPALRAGKAEQTISRFPFNRRMEWRNRISAKRVAGISSEESEELWLDLTNLAVTTGYHSLSRLSSLFFKFSAIFLSMASMSIFHNKKYPRLWKIHRFPLAFSENHCYYSVKAVAGRLDCPPAAAFCSVEVAIQIPLRDVPPCLQKTAIGGFFKTD